MPHVIIRRNVLVHDEPLQVEVNPSDNPAVKELISRFESESRITLADDGTWRAGGFLVTEMLDLLETFGFRLTQMVGGEAGRHTEYVMHRSSGVFGGIHN